MDNSFSLKNYIDAVGESSGRARTVIYILIVASVVAYGTWQMDWTDDRIKVASNAMYYGLWYPPIQQMPDTVTTKDLNQIKHFRNGHRFSAYENVDSVYSLQQIVSKSDFLQSKQAMKSLTFTNQEEMQKYLEFLMDVRTKNHLNFQIPVFGTVYDANDLGLVSGFSFTIVLIMLRSSLFRYSQNLKLTFEEAINQDTKNQTPHQSLTACYDLMSMVQVLTVPPQRGKQEIWPWRVAPKLLYFLPLVVQLMITSDDYRTYPLGELLNPDLNLNQFILEAISCVFIFALTYSSLLLAIDADKEWLERAKQIPVINSTIS